jgi:hypothetical protein
MDTSTGKPLSAENRRIIFLALTFIVIVIVALLCPDAATALIIIGLLLGLAAAYQASGLAGPRWATGSQAPREGYMPLPGAQAPYAVASMTAPLADAGRYPGAIDIDEYDSEAEYGHRDRTEGDNENLPRGNPFNTNRISYPPRAGACIDDEANDAEIDGDEGMVYQGTQRNDPTRVTAGTMNRRRDLDRYFREEVEEAEEREWWGRHEE